ncbi:hypothetical protein N9B42_04235 [Akkermansiaceae bacterium]|nr:hypothetical protein [Akkermansiaceae bacterium]MDB4434173.1 hypothetical protein [Akkermansiaceae bacterium]
MIPVRQEVLHEIDIIGGTAALIQINHWNPHREDQLKFKIICANYDGDILQEWSFNNEEDAAEAFEDLTQRAA